MLQQYPTYPTKNILRLIDRPTNRPTDNVHVQVQTSGPRPLGCACPEKRGARVPGSRHKTTTEMTKNG